jgi:hypothetical protein
MVQVCCSAGEGADGQALKLEDVCLYCNGEQGAVRRPIVLTSMVKMGLKRHLDLN